MAPQASWPQDFLEIWGPGNPEILGSNKSQKTKLSKSKSVSPKMSASSGLVGNKFCWPHLGPFQANFPWAGNMQQWRFSLPIFLAGPMAAIQSDALACIRAGPKICMRRGHVGQVQPLNNCCLLLWRLSISLWERFAYVVKRNCENESIGIHRNPRGIGNGERS